MALPPSYREDQARRYPVIYMQDGQNLFDPTTSYAGDWHLRETLGTLAADGAEAIVVGIANAGKRRIYEYAPFVDPRHGGGGGDRYVAFVSETLKRTIDRDFRTLRGRESTGIAGSSMGGLISLYVAYQRADLFGSVAALSPSLWFAGRALIDYLAAMPHHLYPKVYLDIGLHEPAHAVSDVRSLRDRLLAAGHQGGDTLRYVEDAAGGHDEATWGRRFSRALPFLLGADDSRPDASAPDGPTG